MGSLDDIYDVVQRLDDTNTEYLLVAIQQGKKNGKADVFYNLNNSNSFRILSEGLRIFQKKIEEDENEN